MKTFNHKGINTYGFKIGQRWKHKQEASFSLEIIGFIDCSSRDNKDCCNVCEGGARLQAQLPSEVMELCLSEELKHILHEKYTLVTDENL